MRPHVMIRGAQTGLLLVCLGLVCCKKESAAEKAQKTTTETRASEVKKSRRVFDVSVSAYRARIDFDGDTLVLATPTGLHVAPAAGPASSLPRAFGDVFALRHSTVVYFEQGQLLESVRSEPPKLLGKVPRQPRLIALGEAHVAWVDPGAESGPRIATFRRGQVAEVLTLQGPVDTMVLLGSWAFFFEQGQRGAWRLGGVPLDGGTPVYRAWQTGRVPATLAAKDDALYYYEGPSRTVRRVSPDFAREEVLASGVICSPLAVADRVLCGHVGGVFELPLTGGPPENIAVQASLVAGVASSGHEAAWLSDAGAERLVVTAQLLPLAR